MSRRLMRKFDTIIRIIQDTRKSEAQLSIDPRSYNLYPVSCAALNL